MNATVLMTKAHMTLPTPKPQHRDFHTTDQKPSSHQQKRAKVPETLKKQELL